MNTDGATSMPGAQVKWYSSKVDWWLTLTLCAPPAAAVAVLVRSLAVGEVVGVVVGSGMMLFVGCIYFGLIFPVRYGLSDEQLLIRSGAFRHRISLSDIEEVRPTSNPLSAPTLSRDRLRVEFGRAVGKAVMISPADRDRFLDELAKKTGLERKGDGLLRH